METSDHPLGRDFGHPGLPIRIPPIEGEILSSWLVRLASCYGATLHEFLRELSPKTIRFTGDLDRTPPIDLLTTLANCSGIPLSQIEMMILAGPIRIVLNTLPAKGVLMWALPIMLRDASHHGSQYCPLCLTEDSVPHFRLMWRLAFVTVCPIHRRPLRDTCHSCGRAPNPFRASKPLTPRQAENPLVCCDWCGKDLRHGDQATDASKRVVEGALALQERMLRALEEGWVDLGEGGPIHVVPFFAGLNHLLGVTSGRLTAASFRGFIARAISLPEVRRDIRGKRSARFENQDLATRVIWMAMLHWLTERWPQQLIEAVSSSKVPAGRLLQSSGDDPPFWVHSVIKAHAPARAAVWRKFHLPESMLMSYADLGRRALSKKLKDQEARILFTGRHPELWGDHLALAKAMKAEGLYSQTSEPSIIQRHCARLVALASTENKLMLGTSPLWIDRVRGKWQVVRLAR